MKVTKPILFSATAQAETSRQFYEHTLGLTFVSEFPFALVFETGGVMLRIQKVETVIPPPYTVIGWEVADINQSVAKLNDKGVKFERFGFLTQDESGIWTTPDGAKVAWFKDPDGNTISITQESA